MVPALGDSLASNGVKLAPSYGGTEFGSPTFIVKRKGDEKDWAYMEFSPRAKVRWIHQGDGTYECQFLVGIFRSQIIVRNPIHDCPFTDYGDTFASH